MVCIHIGNSSGHIEQTQSRFPKCLWMFETERNAYRIGIINIIDSLTLMLIMLLTLVTLQVLTVILTME